MRELVAPGPVVIDAGMNGEGKTWATWTWRVVSTVAAALGPVPGGIGPVRGALLLSNLVACLERQQASP